MNIGNKPVYPFEDNRAEYTHEGLTYREWLIGMLASNSQIISRDIPLDVSIEMILDSANAIIKQLDKESE